MEARRNTRKIAVQAIFQFFFSKEDVNKILATTKNNIILTTKKDYYKLSQFNIDNLLYIDIEVKFLDGKQEFLSTIKEVLN